MSRKTTWLMASFLGMAATSYSVAPESREMSSQTQRVASQEPTHPGTPRQFSDLYSVTWEEIPMLPSTPAEPHGITADSIANDGTIAGKEPGGLAIWHPDTQTWELAPRQLGARHVFISPDGVSIVTTDYLQWPEPTNILTWNRAAGWQALSGGVVTQSEAYNVSKNFRFVVGGGNSNGEAEQAWVWAIDGGVQQLLPLPDSSVAAVAGVVSDDGNVVIGTAYRPSQPGDWAPQGFSVRWGQSGAPTILRTPDGEELNGAIACNADCSTVFGVNAWFLKDNGDFGFLGTLPDAYPYPFPYAAYEVSDASSDGSMVVGLYSANLYPAHPEWEIYADRPFIWTQGIGMTSLRTLTSDLGIGDDNWGLISRMRLSPDGHRILISGNDMSERSRVVVLRLIPRVVKSVGGHSTHAMPSSPR